MSTGLTTKNLISKKFIAPYNASTSWGNGYNTTNGFNYDYRTVLFFPTSMTWVSPPYIDEFGYSIYFRPISLLVVGGGGGGGDGLETTGGGGGGGGGVWWQDSYNITPNTSYSIIIGAGGAAGNNGAGSNGGDTHWDNDTYGHPFSYGGGGGGGGANANAGTGGCGGGGMAGYPNNSNAGFGYTGDGGGSAGSGGDMTARIGGGGGGGGTRSQSINGYTNGLSGFTGPWAAISTDYTTPNSGTYPQVNYLYYFKGGVERNGTYGTNFRDSLYGIGMGGAVAGGGGGGRAQTVTTAFGGTSPGVGGTGYGAYATGDFPDTVYYPASDGGNGDSAASYSYGIGGGGGGGSFGYTNSNTPPAPGGKGGVYLFFWNYKVPSS